MSGSNFLKGISWAYYLYMASPLCRFRVFQEAMLRMVILRATRAVFNQAFKDGHTMTVPNFKGLIHVGNRRRLNALTLGEVLRLWEYWLAAPDKQSKYARAVWRWLLLYCLNGMITFLM